MAPKTKQGAIVPAKAPSPPALEEKFLVLGPRAEEMREILRENLGDGQSISAADLRRIKVPTGGATTWLVPPISGDEAQPVLRGIIMHRGYRRAYWEKGMDEGGGKARPQCSSDDGITGVGNPGGSCEQCPLAQFGSHKRKPDAQACKHMMMLFMLPENSILADIIVVPPSSLGMMRKFFA